jgi:hypothetical protein
MFEADDYPDFQVPGFDPEAQKFINGSINDQDKSTQASYERGVAEAPQGLMPSKENAYRTDTSLGRDTKAQTDAILKKGESLFSKEVRNMLVKRQIDQSRAQMSSLNQKYQLSNRQYRIFDQIRQAKIRAETEKIAARNAVIGTVLQVAGGVAGFMVGGPVGAMAGQQVGKAMTPKAQSPRSSRNDQGNGMGDFNDRMYKNDGES